MHVRDTATEKWFDMKMQATLEYFLVQGFKQNRNRQKK